MRSPTVGARKSISAHRFSYLLHLGPVASGQEIDHLCCNQWCANPAHLEAVARRENARRAGRTRRELGDKRNRPKQPHMWRDVPAYARFASRWATLERRLQENGQ